LIDYRNFLRILTRIYKRRHKHYLCLSIAQMWPVPEDGGDIVCNNVAPVSA
jgi:hypothetical protein